MSLEVEASAASARPRSSSTPGIRDSMASSNTFLELSPRCSSKVDKGKGRAIEPDASFAPPISARQSSLRNSEKVTAAKPASPIRPRSSMTSSASRPDSALDQHATPVRPGSALSQSASATSTFASAAPSLSFSRSDSDVAEGDVEDPTQLSDREEAAAALALEFEQDASPQLHAAELLHPYSVSPVQTLHPFANADKLSPSAAAGGGGGGGVYRMLRQAASATNLSRWRMRKESTISGETVRAYAAAQEEENEARTATAAVGTPARAAGRPSEERSFLPEFSPEMVSTRGWRRAISRPTTSDGVNSLAVPAGGVEGRRASATRANPSAWERNAATVTSGDSLHPYSYGAGTTSSKSQGSIRAIFNRRRKSIDDRAGSASPQEAPLPRPNPGESQWEANLREVDTRERKERQRAERQAELLAEFSLEKDHSVRKFKSVGPVNDAQTLRGMFDLPATPAVPAADKGKGKARETLTAAGPTAPPLMVPLVVPKQTRSISGMVGAQVVAKLGGHISPNPSSRASSGGSIAQTLTQHRRTSTTSSGASSIMESGPVTVTRARAKSTGGDASFFSPDSSAGGSSTGRARGDSNASSIAQSSPRVRWGGEDRVQPLRSSGLGLQLGLADDEFGGSSDDHAPAGPSSSSSLPHQAQGLARMFNQVVLSDIGEASAAPTPESTNVPLAPASNHPFAAAYAASPTRATAEQVGNGRPRASSSAGDSTAPSTKSPSNATLRPPMPSSLGTPRSTALEMLDQLPPLSTYTSACLADAAKAGAAKLQAPWADVRAKLLSSSTPKEALPKSWIAYVRAYARGDIDISAAPPPRSAPLVQRAVRRAAATPNPDAAASPAKSLRGRSSVASMRAGFDAPGALHKGIGLELFPASVSPQPGALGSSPSSTSLNNTAEPRSSYGGLRSPKMLKKKSKSREIMRMPVEDPEEALREAEEAAAVGGEGDIRAPRPPFEAQRQVLARSVLGAVAVQQPNARLQAIVQGLAGALGTSYAGIHLLLDEETVVLAQAGLDEGARHSLDVFGSSAHALSESQKPASTLGPTTSQQPTLLRDLTLDAHAILSRGGAPCVVSDLSKDWRFHSRETATDTRFFAGASVLYGAAGLPIGTVSVSDSRARELTREQCDSLTAAAVEVAKELERLQSESVHGKLVALDRDLRAWAAPAQGSVTPATPAPRTIEAMLRAPLASPSKLAERRGARSPMLLTIPSLEDPSALGASTPHALTVATQGRVRDALRTITRAVNAELAWVARVGSDPLEAELLSRHDTGLLDAGELSLDAPVHLCALAASKRGLRFDDDAERVQRLLGLEQPGASRSPAEAAVPSMRRAPFTGAIIVGCGLKDGGRSWRGTEGYVLGVATRSPDVRLGPEVLPFMLRFASLLSVLLLDRPYSPANARAALPPMPNSAPLLSTYRALPPSDSSTQEHATESSGESGLDHSGPQTPSSAGFPHAAAAAATHTPLRMPLSATTHTANLLIQRRALSPAPGTGRSSPAPPRSPLYAKSRRIPAASPPPVAPLPLPPPPSRVGEASATALSPPPNNVALLPPHDLQIPGSPASMVTALEHVADSPAVQALPLPVV